MSVSDVAAWVSLAVGLVTLLGGVSAVLVLAWRAGAMGERLRRTEEIANRLHSDYPKANVELARLDERTKRTASQVDEEEKRR